MTKETRQQWMERVGKEIVKNQAEFDKHFEQMLARRRSEDDARALEEHNQWVRDFFEEKRKHESKLPG
jgi:hypothetical protein